MTPAMSYRIPDPTALIPALGEVVAEAAPAPDEALLDAPDLLADAPLVVLALADPLADEEAEAEADELDPPLAESPDNE